MPRFIAHFSIVISQSVPHIYLSALPFVPKRSSIAKQYGPQYPQTLGIEQGGTPNWSPAVNILSGHIDTIFSVAFSPDGRRIVSGSDDKTVRIWDAETGQQLGSSLEGHDGGVTPVAFSPDGRRIVSGSYDKT
ncbi:POC1 centriolar protein A, partial [Serendipita sp. 407]